MIHLPLPRATTRPVAGRLTVLNTRINAKRELVCQCDQTLLDAVRHGAAQAVDALRAIRDHLRDELDGLIVERATILDEAERAIQDIDLEASQGGQRLMNDIAADGDEQQLCA